MEQDVRAAYPYADALRERIGVIAIELAAVQSLLTLGPGYEAPRALRSVPVRSQ